MKLKRGTFDIATRGGPLMVGGYVVGEFGIDKRDPEMSHKWFVTHLRTGFCFNTTFLRLKDAVLVATRAMKFADGKPWKCGAFGTFPSRRSKRFRDAEASFRYAIEALPLGAKRWNIVVPKEGR